MGDSSPIASTVSPKIVALISKKSQHLQSEIWNLSFVICHLSFLKKSRVNAGATDWFCCPLHQAGWSQDRGFKTQATITNNSPAFVEHCVLVRLRNTTYHIPNTKYQIPNDKWQMTNDKWQIRDFFLATSNSINPNLTKLLAKKNHHGQIQRTYG